MSMPPEPKMTTAPAAPTSSATGSSFPGGISLAVLYWMELRYLSVAFKGLRHYSSSEEDAWWIWVDCEVRGPFRFMEVLRVILDGSGLTSIVHQSRASEDPTPWKTIYYQPWWSNRLIARFWTVAFWFIFALLGWILVTCATPLASHTFVDAAYWLVLACIIMKRRALRIWMNGLRAKLSQRGQKVPEESRGAAYESDI